MKSDDERLDFYRDALEEIVAAEMADHDWDGLAEVDRLKEIARRALDAEVDQAIAAADASDRMDAAEADAIASEPET